MAKISVGEGDNKPLSQQFPSPEGPAQYPWLLYYHGKRNYDITFCTISPSGPTKTERKKIPELYDKTVVSCSDGWLLLCNKKIDSCYSIWNPATSESFNLPHVRTEFENRIDHSLLSSPPSDPSCLVLLFLYCDHIILYCHPGDEEWTEFNYGESLKAQTVRKHPQGNFLSDPVSCNGKIYTSCTAFSYLVSINLDEFNNICSISLLNQDGPEWYHPHSNCITRFLVGVENELFYVQLCDDTSPSEEIRDTLIIEVDKFNFSTNLWEKARSLNGRAIFLGLHYSLSCTVEYESDVEEAAGSCIYFTVEGDETLYSYRIEDESITPYLPCPDLPKPRNLIPTWIMPARRTEYVATKEELPKETNEIEGGEGNAIIGSIEVTANRAECVNQHYVTTKEEVLPKENSEVEGGGNNIGESLETKSHLFSDLQPEMLTAIDVNLSFDDDMNIRCVNKFFAPLNSFTRPSLIFSKRNERIYELVDSTLLCKHTITIPEAIEDHTIHYARDGWLLTDKRSAITFFNPFTKETIEFPDTPLECYTISSFIFTSSPSSSDCLVIAILGIGFDVHFNYIRRGDEEWRGVVFEGDNNHFEPSCSSPVFHNGSFYFQSKDGSLGVLQVLQKGDDGNNEVGSGGVGGGGGGGGGDGDDNNEDAGVGDDEDEGKKDGDANDADEDGDHREYDDDRYDIKWTVLDQLRRPCKHFRCNYLVECDGNLLSVFEVRKGERVWVRVFKLINDDEDWQEIKTLGNYSLYLSRYSSIACIEERPDMANRIYFPRFYQDGLVYYSLHTKKYHSFGSSTLLENFYGTRMYNDCAWLKPNWP